jgi:hypothetical protein
LAAAELALTLQRSAHAKARSAYSGYIAAVLQLDSAKFSVRSGALVGLAEVG